MMHDSLPSMISIILAAGGRQQAPPSDTSLRLRQRRSKVTALQNTCKFQKTPFGTQFSQIKTVDRDLIREKKNVCHPRTVT